MVGPQKITTLENGYNANLRYDDKSKASTKVCLPDGCRMVERDRHDLNLYLGIL